MSPRRARSRWPRTGPRPSRRVSMPRGRDAVGRQRAKTSRPRSFSRAARAACAPSTVPRCSTRTSAAAAIRVVREDEPAHRGRPRRGWSPVRRRCPRWVSVCSLIATPMTCPARAFRSTARSLRSNATLPGLPPLMPMHGRSSPRLSRPLAALPRRVCCAMLFRRVAQTSH